MQRFLSKPMLKPKSNSLFYNKTPIKTMILPESHRHRKLIGAPPNTTTDIHPFCTFECDPQINPTGLCSADCSYFCPPFCRTAESSPSPSPATAPYSFPPPSNHHHPPLSLPLKISLIFLILTFIYSLYKFYTVCHRSRPRPTPPENQDSTDDFLEVLDHPIWYIRTTGLDPSVINNLPVMKFSRINSPENQHSADDFLDCSVCLSEFEEDDTVKLLPNCNHAFHISCIDTWLRSHQNCPLCRAGIVKNTGDSTSSEQNDGNLGVNREINLGVLSDFDLGFDGSGSSGLRIGETDADELNSNLNTNLNSNLDNDSVKRNGL